MKTKYFLLIMLLGIVSCKDINPFKKEFVLDGTYVSKKHFISLLPLKEIQQL